MNRRRKKPPMGDDAWGIGDRPSPPAPSSGSPEPAGFGMVPVEPSRPAPLVTSNFDSGLVEFAREAVQGARADTTTRGYEFDWELFKAFCRAHLVPFLPADPDVVVLYFAHLVRDGRPRSGRRKGRAGYSMATLDRARASISHAHHQAGKTSPTDHPRVADVMKGLRRKQGEAPARARPLMPEHLAAIVGKLRAVRTPTKFLRDRALLLGGFAGALRRSEIVALTWGKVRLMAQSIYFALDQQQGRKVSEVIPGTKYHSVADGQHVSFEMDPRLVELGICPIAALREWGTVANEGEDSYFLRRVIQSRVEPEALSSRKVERLVKEGTAMVGLDPKFYGGHSLRAGMATYLIWEQKWNLFAVRDYLRHENVETLNVYVRDWDELPTSTEGML